MRTKGYYSVRTGKRDGSITLTLTQFKKLFLSLYNKFSSKGYFQEGFGFYCVDSGFIPGKLGQDIDSAMLLALRKEDLWPLDDRLNYYSEADLFDVIEFLFDHISAPLEEDGFYHNYDDCGWHYKKFDKVSGKVEFRKELNILMRDYDVGYELSESGEILTLVEDSMVPLVEAGLPVYDPPNVEDRVNIAKSKFRRGQSSFEDRRHALQDLAAVLEYLRPRVKEVLNSKDESDLYEIANKFGIRHHNPSQKTDYDPAIWYSWMFYYYLATIHACIRLLQKSQEQKKERA